MCKILVHIGLHKTGTSSIQSFLKRNAAQLLERGVVYRLPEQAWPNHHHIASGYGRGKDHAVPRKFIRDLIEQSGDNLILLSSEMFSEGTFDIDSFFRDVADCDVSAIAYIRNPCDSIVSAYNQTVKDSSSRRTLSIDELPYPYDPSYWDLLSPWISRTQLVLCPYDRKQWKNESLVSDFLSMIGIDDLPVQTEVFENKSLAHSVVEIIRQANIAGIPEQVRSEVIRLLSEVDLGEEPYPLNRAASEKIQLRFGQRLGSYVPLFRPFFDVKFLLDLKFSVDKGQSGSYDYKKNLRRRSVIKFNLSNGSVAYLNPDVVHSIIPNSEGPGMTVRFEKIGENGPDSHTAWAIDSFAICQEGKPYSSK